MVSTQDFAREVWVSLENIRERLAVVETEIRHARRDMVRLERGAGVPPRAPTTPSSGGSNGDESNADVVHLRFNRKLLGGSAAGAAAAATAAVGRVLGWW